MRPWSRGKQKDQDDPAPAEPRPAELASSQADDEVELSPLEQRLSTMEWPKPPPGVRERLFEQIVERAEQNGDASAPPEEPDSNGAAGRG